LAPAAFFVLEGVFERMGDRGNGTRRVTSKCWLYDQRLKPIEQQ
jgi:hypothetical protein